ncbi:MAG: bifunctional glycosyltransferase family 2/GtrA family protein [Actinomycetota bacterium]|nr:bifunctional glycosyltransferase family 2/GtrA family protein [Actinomycetota bacterium]
MTTASAGLLSTDSGTSRWATDVEIVIPVYNEEAGLEASIHRLHGYLTERFPFTWVITIADNASRDRTWGIACRLAGELPGVRAVHLLEKGRGRALRAAWMASAARVVAYMDVDLSTDLDALLPLVAPLLSGHSDVAIGTRLGRGARVVRGARREIISRSYNLIVKSVLGNGFSDAQCGFKALRADVARALVPLVDDECWFFDTELLVLAEHNGLRIHEVPVDWTDDPDSRVDVASTAMEDLRGIGRLVRRFAADDGNLPAGALPGDADAVEPALAGQLIRFAGVGALSTALFAVLFVLLAGPFGLGPVAADVVALGLSAAANTAANRRVTFAQRGRFGRRRHYRAALVVALLPLMLTVMALVGAGWVGVATVTGDLLVLTAVNATAAVARFLLLRHWVFR